MTAFLLITWATTQEVPLHIKYLPLTERSRAWKHSKSSAAVCTVGAGFCWCSLSPAFTATEAEISGNAHAVIKSKVWKKKLEAFVQFQLEVTGSVSWWWFPWSGRRDRWVVLWSAVTASLWVLVQTELLPDTSHGTSQSRTTSAIGSAASSSAATDDTQTSNHSTSPFLIISTCHLSTFTFNTATIDTENTGRTKLWVEWNKLAKTALLGYE